MNVSEDQIIGQLVAEDYRTASVFKAFNIDFCCKGNRSIKDVCERKNLDPSIVLEQLKEVCQNTNTNAENFTAWDLDLLVDYIEKKHHRYVTSKIPELKAYLSKVARVHGERHPELIEIDRLFTDSAVDLLNHMKKEENILFPYVRRIMQNKAENNTYQQPAFGSVQNPIKMMMHEHENEGDRFRRIAELTNNYTAPSDACTTYRVSFLLLKEFEDDLHLHIHLENNILFPKAMQMEASLASAN